MALHAPQFVSWSRPLAVGVARALLEEARDSGQAGKLTCGQGAGEEAQRPRGSEARNGMPIDLGSHRVIVPSSFASRLIQEELAKLTSGPVDRLTCGQGKAEEAQRPGGSEATDSWHVDKLASGQGALLPVFQTPTEFLNFGDASLQVASSADALMAWIEVLQSTLSRG